ncbi:hypothetical protein GGR28_002061 [Lewinella aquimaris]|uniref:Cupin domain-containing protein n=1 Tax=Neolewinella aquimaris TaxID=1835722 RepID=A0A840E2K0_9BACT|nr:hypothetical protein [Neolewinella aquimaris]MBB4079441.1 hypothetical protein [Neolewinella aquimaris]
MKINKTNIPVTMEAPGMKMRTKSGFGGMDANFHDLPAGTDFTPLLKGLENDSCHCPHYGYLFEGKLKVIYDDGKEEIIQAGDMFYLPPGHTAIVEEDIKFMDFSPTKEHTEVLTHVGEMMAKMG